MAVPPPARHMTSVDPKVSLRREMRARRREFVRGGNAQPIKLPDFLLPKISEATVVAAYLPQRFEADSLQMIEQCRVLGARIALPHVVAMGEPMRFLGWAPENRLETNALGIEQPAEDSPELAPDIILTPLVAFDAQLNRLGQGGGFYDRAFAAHPHALRVGVAWSIQQTEHIPVERWDMPLHAIVTERTTIKGKDL